MIERTVRRTARPGIAETARRRLSATAALCSVVVVVTVAAGCTDPSPPGAWGEVRGTASSLVPSATLRDWVSYGDQLAVLRITSERPRPAAGRDGGGGLVLRQVGALVDSVAWSRPEAERLPEQLKITTTEWASGGDGRGAPTDDASSPRLAVGGRYLVLLARFPDGTWAALADTVLPYVDGHVRLTDRLAARAAHVEAVDAVSGRTVEEVARLLERTAPYRVAVAKASLDPIERYEAVEGARGP